MDYFTIQVTSYSNMLISQALNVIIFECYLIWSDSKFLPTLSRSSFHSHFNVFLVFTKKSKGDSLQHQAPASLQSSTSHQAPASLEATTSQQASTLTQAQTCTATEALSESTSSQPSTSAWYQNTLSLPASTSSPSTLCLDDDLASLPTLTPASTLFLPPAQISTSHSAPTSSKANLSSDVSLGLSSSPKAKSKCFSMWYNN